MSETSLQQSLDNLRGILIPQLRGLRYADSTIGVYECHIRRLGEFMGDIGAALYSPDVGERFLGCPYCNETARRQRMLKAFISRLDDCLLGVGYHLYHCKRRPPKTPSKYAEPEGLYLQSCEAKGNAPSTLEGKKNAFAKFVLRLEEVGCSSFCELSPEHVTKAILVEQNAENYGHVREILRFLANIGMVGHDLSGLVPKRGRPFHLPSTYDKDERLRLENAPDRNTALGKRDYAIILLANRLGMRSGDIAGLSFDGMDFGANTIRFEQDKTGEPHELYMVPDVRDAIRDYVDNGRPKSDDAHVFMMHKAPYLPVSAIAIHGIVAKGFRTANIDTSGKRHGAHSLRSSLATDMVNSGESYDQTRRVLGHRSRDAVRHYAKLDIDRLRLCALEARDATGFFARFLNGEEVVL